MSFREDLGGIPEQLGATLRIEGGSVESEEPLWIGGMGGSAAAADFFVLCLGEARAARVLREPTLPADVNGTLIVISYSGETEESLSLWREARERGMGRAVVSSGGALWRMGEEEDCPRVMLPSGLAPRNALGYLLRGLIAVTKVAADWGEASTHLASIRERVGSRDAVFMELSERLEAARLPVLLAGDAHGLCAARRWRASLAENAKVAATVWELPEAAHNRIVTAGRDAPRRDLLSLFALGTPREARACARWEAVLSVLEAHGSKSIRVNVPHRTAWIEALGLAYLGDWLSVELAQRLGVDPEPISLMTDVKSRLREGKESRT